MTIFLKVLSKIQSEYVPVYCTGYPKTEFINNFIYRYKLKSNPTEYTLHGNDYNFIKLMSFNAISIWDYRRGKGGYELNKSLCVDGWSNLSNILISYGTPQKVKKYLVKLISKSRQTNTLLVISPTQQIDSAIKPKNIKKKIETTKNF